MVCIPEMTAAHLILSNWWKSTGKLPRHADGGEATIERIEQSYNVKLPEDFRDYLLELIPDEDFWDSEDVIWWSADRLKNIPEEYEHEITDTRIAASATRYIFFADYCIWMWAWAICCDEGQDYGKVAMIGGAGQFVANSFTEFVEAYVVDPFSVS